MALVARVKNILTAPATEWPVIAGEAADTGSLYKSYIVPLAAIGPVALLFRSLVFGMGIGIGLWVAILAFVTSLITVYVLAFIISKLAPSFSGRDDMGQALKLSAYASTALWVSKVTFIIPVLGILSLLGALYSLYLLYTGAGVLMGVRQERTLGYTAVVVIVAILVYVVLALVLGVLLGGGMMGMMGTGRMMM